MALRLIVGRANIGKTGLALDAVRQAHADGRRPVLVLPSQPDVARAADELAGTDPLGFTVLTFDAFLANAWGRSGDGRTLLAGPTRRLLASAAARQAGVGSGMGDLASACVISLSEQMGEAWRVAKPTVQGIGAGLAAAIRNYQGYLEAMGLVEREEAAFILSESGLLPGDPLVVHRFIDFTPWQERLLHGAARTHDVLVTLTWEEGFAPTQALDPLVDRLAATGVVSSGEVFHTKPELAVVADRLFSAPAKITPGGAVRFSLAEGHEAEAHRIADEVRLAMEETGSSDRPPSIVVVFRHPERHIRFLREAFDEAGIDADFDVRTPLASTAFGSAVLSMLRFVVSGDRDLLLSVLKSPFGGGDRESCLGVEADWRSRGLAVPSALIADLWRASKGLQRIMRAVERDARAPIDAAGTEALAKAVGELLVLGYGRSGSTNGMSVEDAAAHAAILAVLGAAATVDASPILLQDVVDALQRAIVTSPAEERAGVVQVTAVDRVRGRRYDTVIIGGLNSDEFPAPPSESMLPGSAVAAVLTAFGGKGEPLKGAEYEQLLFYMALTRAQQRVVLSARTADSDGDPAGLSPLFEAVADSYRPDGDEDARPPAEFRALSQPPRQSKTATQREGLRASAYAQSEDPRSSAAKWRSRSRRARLAEDSSLERLRSTDVYSPSALDAYLECPYRWFYSRTVRPGRLESEFDAASQGSFAHEVMARAYATLQEGGIARVVPETLEASRRAVRAAWEAVDAEFGKPGSVLERSDRMTTLMWANRIMEHDASFAPGFSAGRLEWSFGFGEDDAVDVGGFSLRGIVDRIDSDDAGRAIVIDYKRSGGPSADDILKKRKIQVPLYFAAVRTGLGLEPVAGIYRGLRTCEDRGLVLEDANIIGDFKKTDIKGRAEFDSIIEGALELARTAVKGIRAGRIEQKPFDPTSCLKCDAFAVCGGAR